MVQVLGEHLQVKSHVCVGGKALKYEVDSLHDGQHVVVGTPGRVYDMIGKGHLCLDDLLTFICDNASDLFSNTLKDQTTRILKKLPASVQICFFSAPMAPELVEWTSTIMRDAVRIVVEKDELPLEGIRQLFVCIEREEWKIDRLCDLALTFTHAIIYCNTRRKAVLLADQLRTRGFTNSVMHADLPQKERDLSMHEFGSGSSRLLISTDLNLNNQQIRSRMSLSHVNLVVNFDVPGNMENYVRRIELLKSQGPGHFGRELVAINFMTNNDVGKLKNIEDFYHIQMEPLPTNWIRKSNCCRA
eukprot:gnl/TRDRNA2_/TRDRNA2_140137_c1_seq2.p1 gnl/TRDRNA2_/TRDRNA2_140137_c1~~gnl/TRDRNA2_/TRDRNA2_140137_c1_seq2.p1  ORF type:complete len:341 (+),score=57.30 gnl/TRDRNA2_/TRDRNA2_140137_c1_seq2:119-1024(+)